MNSRILSNLLDETTNLINRGECAQALVVITQAKQFIQATDIVEPQEEEAASIDERIEEQRGELFGVEAAIGVAQRSIHPDKEYDLHRVLGDAYAAIDAIAGALDEIATDYRHTKKVSP